MLQFPKTKVTMACGQCSKFCKFGSIGNIDVEFHSCRFGVNIIASYFKVFENGFLHFLRGERDLYLIPFAGLTSYLTILLDKWMKRLY